MDKENNLNEKIGKVLREKRKESNYSLEDLQYLLKEEAGITLDISSISRYESGTVKNMNPIYIKSICKIIGLDYLEIYKELKFIDNKDDPRISELNKREKGQYKNLLEQNALFFNDESVSEEDKKKMVDALTEAFYAIKKSNKRKLK